MFIKIDPDPVSRACFETQVPVLLVVSLLQLLTALQALAWSVARDQVLNEHGACTSLHCSLCDDLRTSHVQASEFGFYNPFSCSCRELQVQPVEQILHEMLTYDLQVRHATSQNDAFCNFDHALRVDLTLFCGCQATSAKGRICLLGHRFCCLIYVVLLFLFLFLYSSSAQRQHGQRTW